MYRSTVFAWLVPILVAAVAAPSDATTSSTIALKTLAANPAAFIKRNVAVTGWLENQGKNYFTDLRIVLRDAEGNLIRVRPWLPLSLPPRPVGGEGKAPATLSEFLGKHVELTAVVEKGDLGRTSGVFFLNVKAAKVLSGGKEAPARK